MSSFRWGMIASSTPTYRQVIVWELRHLLFSPHSSIVLLTVLHCKVHLGSEYMTPHLGLSLCNALEQIRPPYPIWKGTSIACSTKHGIAKAAAMSKYSNFYTPEIQYHVRTIWPQNLLVPRGFWTGQGLDFVCPHWDGPFCRCHLYISPQKNFMLGA